MKPNLVADDLQGAAKLVPKRREHSPVLPANSAARLRSHLRESISTKERVLAECEEAMLEAAGIIAKSLARGGKLLLCGNGGSAADCQHIAAEFVSVLTQDYLRPGLPAIALTTDTSILTASANDFGFEGVFERQVQALARAGDVLIGISTSGNSSNVARALEYANGHEVATIAMTGGSGGKIAGITRSELRVPSSVTMHIQEAHITMGHILCDLVERALGPAK